MLTYHNNMKRKSEGVALGGPKGSGVVAVASIRGNALFLSWEAAMAKLDLHISERLRNTLPPLSDDARKKLEASIIRDGRVTDPILYWFDGTKNVVIDGMHRWEIIERLQITDYKTEEMPSAGTTYEEVEAWIWDHQAGRRNLSREVIGKWYNNIKAAQGGDRKTKGSNDTLVNAAEKISEKTGVSPSTVKRAAARVDSESKLTKAAKVVADKATDAEVKALSQLEVSDQDQVARLVRTGKVKTIKDGLKGFKPATPAKPEKPSNGQPPKQYDRSFWYKQWTTSIGPLVRLVDKIAREVDEMHGARHRGVKEGLDLATRNMIEWMGVKK